MNTEGKESRFYGHNCLRWVHTLQHTCVCASGYTDLHSHELHIRSADITAYINNMCACKQQTFLFIHYTVVVVNICLRYCYMYKLKTKWGST